MRDDDGEQNGRVGASHLRATGGNKRPRASTPSHGVSCLRFPRGTHEPRQACLDSDYSIPSSGSIFTFQLVSCPFAFLPPSVLHLLGGWAKLHLGLNPNTGGTFSSLIYLSRLKSKLGPGPSNHPMYLSTTSTMTRFSAYLISADRTSMKMMLFGRWIGAVNAGGMRS